MVVGALGMHHLAEQSLPHKVEREHFDLAVDAVLKLHAVYLAFFASLHHLPAILQRHGGGHFGQDVLAAVHRRQRDGHMQVPRRRVVDNIDITRVAQRLVRVGALIDLRFRLLLPRETRLRVGDLRILYVAYRRNRHPGKFAHAADHGAAARTCPHDPHAHRLQRLTRETEHRRTCLGLPCRHLLRVHLQPICHRICGPGDQAGFQKISPAVHLSPPSLVLQNLSRVVVKETRLRQTRFTLSSRAYPSGRSDKAW